MSTYTEKHKIYYQNHKDHVKKKSREWKKNNYKLVMSRSKQYRDKYLSNPANHQIQLDAVNNYKKYYYSIPGNYENHVSYMGKLIYNIRMRLLELLGDSCSNITCPIPKNLMDVRALHIDHINGGGHRDSKSKGGTSMYRYYLEHPEEARKNLQLLCAYCNWLKRYDKQELMRNKIHIST